MGAAGDQGDTCNPQEGAIYGIGISLSLLRTISASVGADINHNIAKFWMVQTKSKLLRHFKQFWNHSNKKTVIYPARASAALMSILMRIMFFVLRNQFELKGPIFKSRKCNFNFISKQPPPSTSTFVPCHKLFDFKKLAQNSIIFTNPQFLFHFSLTVFSQSLSNRDSNFICRHWESRLWQHMAHQKRTWRSLYQRRGKASDL